MEIELLGNLVAKCDKCGEENWIDLDMLSEDVFVTERSMGDDVLHTFYGECRCENCQRTLGFSINISEYPIGCIDYCSEEEHGCELIEIPTPAIRYYEYEFDAYDEKIISNEISNLQRLIDKESSIYDITPREFELLVAEVFERYGYSVRVTKETRDGGCDIIATQCLNGIPFMIIIECKHYSRKNKVDIKLVRELYATQTDKKANKSILVTSSFFTRDAKKYAEEHNTLITLIDIENLMEMIEECK